jgi:hypothetical protein
MAIASNKRLGDEPIEQARQAAAEALQKAKEACEMVGCVAGHTAEAVGKKADDLTAAAGHEIKSAGDAIDKKSPDTGVTGMAGHAVAGTLQGSGGYIEKAKLSGMAHDLAQVIRDHPVPTMLVCFGLGYCVARMIRD